MRILSAMMRVVSEHCAESATVARVIGLVGVSRRMFYDCFADRSDCLLTAIEDAVALAAERGVCGREQMGGWRARRASRAA
jgi:AcrR family transcriptional regulator